MSVKLLDCTLRDGGYYNKWAFEPELVSDYLETMASSGIDFVELGLRQFKNNKFLGAHAYTTTQYLDRLELPDGPVYGAMIDAKTILSEKRSQEDCIDTLFNDAKNERIDLVRIAAHFTEVKSCLPMIKRLKSKGYMVGLNIMQASLRSVEELEDLSAFISGWSCIDVLYFADSLGSMEYVDMVRVYSALRKNWRKEIGFHAHNNMGNAVSNARSAVELGCTWIDGTVTGMGRGAGNAETEFLLLDSRFNKTQVDKSKLFELVDCQFNKLKKAHGWGATIPYYLGALGRLHPTYVQTLCADESLVTTLIPQIISDLSDLPNPEAFDESTLTKVKAKINPVKKLVDGNKVSPIMKGREVILLAQTALAIDYRDAIEDYCNKKNPIVVSINQPSSELDLNYDFVVISHNEKFRDDEDAYLSSDYKYVAPKALFSGLNINIVHDYGLLISEGDFKNCGSHAIVPNRLTLPYAISFCVDAGAEQIKLIGFGGDGLEDNRYKEMQAFLQILAGEKMVEIYSLTPTTFSIPELSIYAI